MIKTSILADFQAYTESLINTHKIPAISLAVWHNGQLHEAAAGILNLETGVEATTDSIFQIGSISKVMTSSLVMQLVDEGKVDLDKPVKHYIRDFAIADEEATESITVRQLLNHTSGMDGDFFPDDHHQTGNPIARFVDRCNLLPLVHPVGEQYSYSNTAFAIAGRLVEVVTGTTWFDAIEERIFKPLGMNHAICRPMDVLRYRAAIGHIPNPESSGPDSPDYWQQSEQLYLSLGQAPAGATITMSARDLITFARAHMNRGLTQNGERWLSETAIAEMQKPQIEIPSLSSVTNSHAGLNWGLHRLNTNGRLIYGHGGGTYGQMSMLRIVADQDTCIAVLVNAEHAEVAYQTVINALLKEWADFDLTEPEPSFVTVPDEQLAHYIGDYQSSGEHYAITLENGQLTALYKDLATKAPAVKTYLKPLDDALWMGFSEEGVPGGKLRFLEPDDSGHYRYIFSTRMLPRTNTREA